MTEDKKLGKREGRKKRREAVREERKTEWLVVCEREKGCATKIKVMKKTGKVTSSFLTRYLKAAVL